MPLKPKKKSPAKKKSQPKLRSVKKPKLVAKSQPKAPNLFRQILAQRERTKDQPHSQQYRLDHRGQPVQPSRHEQFAKFAGPRRRAA